MARPEPGVVIVDLARSFDIIPPFVLGPRKWGSTCEPVDFPGRKRTASPNRSDLGGAARYASLGLQFVVGACFGFYVGMKIDQWIGLSGPIVCAPLLSLAGAAGGLASLIREVVRPKRDRRD